MMAVYSLVLVKGGYFLFSKEDSGRHTLDQPYKRIDNRISVASGGNSCVQLFLNASDISSWI